MKNSISPFDPSNIEDIRRRVVEINFPRRSKKENLGKEARKGSAIFPRRKEEVDAEATYVLSRTLLTCRRVACSGWLRRVAGKGGGETEKDAEEEEEGVEYMRGGAHTRRKGVGRVHPGRPRAAQKFLPSA